MPCQLPYLCRPQDGPRVTLRKGVFRSKKTAAMNKKQTQELLEAIFDEPNQLFSYNFAFFERPIFELTNEQKIRDLNEVYSEFEQEQLYEKLEAYKKLSVPVLKQNMRKRGTWRLVSGEKWIGDLETRFDSGKLRLFVYRRDGEKRMTHKRVPLCTLDTMYDIESYIKTHYPQILLNKDAVFI